MKDAAKRRRGAYPEHREAFKLKLLSNPNFFGTLVESPWEPVFPMSDNTYYEELVCVGYHPQQRQLEAIVHIHQPSGYGTDVCGPGTPEFVRFYLSSDGGATWQDQGMTSFQAFNIPEGTEGSGHLEYAVSLAADPPARFCTFDPVAQVRAILSWNDPPPANQPNWTPVWGNVHEVPILVEPYRLIFPFEVFELAQIELPPDLEQILDLDFPMQAKKQVLGAAELAELYSDEDVPVHRFALQELSAFTSGTVSLDAQAFAELLPEVAIDPGLFEKLIPQDGNTSYEELRCVGLDPNVPDTLIGVIQLKLPSGYSGGPCTDGSREYVTFWADWDDDGSFEDCLGTAEVRVYDLTSIPAEGVFCAVRLPVDVEPYRQACEKGARLVRIRAILSWSVPAPCANPNHVPVWGNREETVIHITPVPSVPAGHISILGGIPVSHIDAVTGLTTATAVFATNNLPPDSLGRPCPFAGRVTAQGLPMPGYSYVVEVSQDGSVWSPVLTDLVVTDQFGATSVHKADPVTKRFDYLPFSQNTNSLLAQWDSAGNALWYVRLTVFDAGGVQQGAPDVHRIQLDNTWPDAYIAMNPGTPACGKFAVGTHLSGTFVARDDFFGRYTLTVEPAINPAGVGVPVPASGNVQTAVAPGDPWTLDTHGMKPCGYIIRLRVVDRAIRNSQWVGHWSPDSVGFCLE